MFSRHLCSYIVLLLNDWSTPMLNMYCFVTYDCNSPLIMTYCASKHSTSIIESTTLVNVCDLAHFAFLALYPLIWKQRYYFPSGESFWTGIWVLLLSWHWSGSYPDKTFSLGSVTLWLFFWEFQTTMNCHQPRYLYSSFFCVWDRYRFS